MAGNVGIYSCVPRSMTTPRGFMIGKPQNTERARFLASFNEDFERARDSLGITRPIYLKGNIPERFLSIFGPQKAGFSAFIREYIASELEQAEHTISVPEETDAQVKYSQSSVQLHSINWSLPFQPIETSFAEKAAFLREDHGEYLFFLKKALIKESLSPEGYEFHRAVIHETLHGNSFGFAPTPLDEGATHFFTRHILGNIFIPMFSPKLADKHASMEIFRVADLYGIWSMAIEQLGNVVGIRNLSDAYFYGETSGILTKLGSQKWKQIQDLAFRYPLAQQGVGLHYLEKFLGILGISIEQMAEQNNPLLLRPSVKMLD